MSEKKLNKAQLLHQEYLKSLKTLQDSCGHDSLSGWTKVMWAPGRFASYEVRVCDECGKNVHLKLWCDFCRKELIDDECVPGDGKNHPVNVPFCHECVKKPYQKGTYQGAFNEDALNN